MESKSPARAVPDAADGFPFVRRFGDVALIALSSAIPTMPFIAAGKLGSAQRALLANALDRLKQASLFRVVLIRELEQAADEDDPLLVLEVVEEQRLRSRRRSDAG